MSAHILVIEDEEAINDLICMNLEVTGYQVTAFFDGNEASKGLSEKDDYDCALLDVMLPGKDGFALLPELKAHGIPVIFLTARGEVQNKVRGLKEGAEDYLKPMEYECLLLFVRHKNKALTRKQILGTLWGMEFEGETRTVDAHVGRIRKKLGWGNVIKTIPTVGYRLEVDE